MRCKLKRFYKKVYKYDVQHRRSQENELRTMIHNKTSGRLHTNTVVASGKFVRPPGLCLPRARKVRDLII